jgi:hypothetical protein
VSGQQVLTDEARAGVSELQRESANLKKQIQTKNTSRQAGIFLQSKFHPNP